MGSHDSVRRPSWARQRIEALIAEHLGRAEEALSVELVRLEKDRDRVILEVADWKKVVEDPSASPYTKEYARRRSEVCQQSIATGEARIKEKRSSFESEFGVTKRRREAVEDAFEVLWKEISPSSRMLTTHHSDCGERRLLALAPDGQFFVWLIRCGDRGGSMLIDSPDQLTNDELAIIFKYEQKQAAAKAGATT